MTNNSEIDNKVAEYLERAWNIGMELARQNKIDGMNDTKTIEIAKMIQRQEIHENRKSTDD